MNTNNLESLPRSVSALLIAVAVGTAVGHVFTVERVYEPNLTRAAGEESSPYPTWPAKRPLPTPLLRSNDRSRWCTIRALVDEGTYVIGRRDPSQATKDNPYGDSGIVFEDGWFSVDKVLRPDTQEFYSSKPPLLPTILAGEYWVLKHAFGWTLAGDAPSRWWVVRVILLTVNVLPLAIYLLLLDRLAGRLGATDWGRLFVVVTACFGTFVTSFMGALNNHTLATCCLVFALAPALRAAFGRPEDDRGWRYAVAGFFAAFTACSDLPAAAFLAALLGLLMLRSPRKTLLWFVPAAAVPVAAFLLCNYVAIGLIQPAYSELGSPWYKYPGSNFNPDAPEALRRGVDWAREKESAATYVYHSVLGHHGILSLSPVWLLSASGLVLWLFPGAAAAPPDRAAGWLPGPLRDERRVLAILTLLVSAVVIAFYLVLAPRNYGGWTLGPRWLMWLTPLWLLVLLPMADRMSSSRTGRFVAAVLLGFSVLSAVVPAGSPWHHPWIYTVLEQIRGPYY